VEPHGTQDSRNPSPIHASMLTLRPYAPLTR
jgi:hypothetical protein